MSPWVALQSKWSKDDIERHMQTKPPTQMSRKDRQRLCRDYVHYVIQKYTTAFNSQHVMPDVIAAVASSLTKTFPSMFDTGSEADNPTYVSKCNA